MVSCYTVECCTMACFDVLLGKLYHREPQQSIGSERTNVLLTTTTTTTTILRTPPPTSTMMMMMKLLVMTTVWACTQHR